MAKGKIEIELKQPEVVKEKNTAKKEIAVIDLPGVGAATATKLKETGYTDLMSIAVASPGELVDSAGVGESTARKMIQFARNSLEMGFESGLVNRIISLVNQNEYKRYQTPPILRISSKAFGIGRRLPLVARY